MKYIGDYAEDYATLNFKFSTHKADGTPITLAGTPAVSVYKANSTTQSTAGITLTTDFDGVTGLHNVLIDLSADAFFSTGNDYAVVITTGTVDSISVVGTVLAHFSIENRYSVFSDYSTYLMRTYYINNQKMTVVDATGVVAVRNDADSSSLATGQVTDDLTTTIRSAFTWA